MTNTNFNKDQKRLVAALDTAKGCLAKLNEMGCTIQGLLGIGDDDTPIVGIEPPPFRWDGTPRWRVRYSDRVKTCYAVEFERCLVRWIVIEPRQPALLTSLWNGLRRKLTHRINALC